MRTKTLALSALLGLLGSASAMAGNVYSLNAVGYINVTIPATSYSIIACPLQCSPDNTLNTIANNGAGNPNGAGYLNNCSVTFVTAGLVPSYSSDTAEAIGGKTGTSYTNGWANNGTLALNPGAACWFHNPTGSAKTLTFVGQVPQGSLTNNIVPGYNLISSAVPTSGDLCSNTITQLTGYTVNDVLYMYDPSTKFANSGIGGTYTSVPSTGKNPGIGYHHNWAVGDPTTFAPSQGFYYDNKAAGTYHWVENFTVNP